MERAILENDMMHPGVMQDLPNVLQPSDWRSPSACPRMGRRADEFNLDRRSRQVHRRRIDELEHTANCAARDQRNRDQSVEVVISNPPRTVRDLERQIGNGRLPWRSLPSSHLSHRSPKEKRCGYQEERNQPQSESPEECARPSLLGSVGGALCEFSERSVVIEVSTEPADTHPALMEKNLGGI